MGEKVSHTTLVSYGEVKKATFMVTIKKRMGS